MKFNIDDYKGKYVMHCKTEEEAKVFCTYLDSIGQIWCAGDSYLSSNYWHIYKESTCYNFNAGTYYYKEYYKRVKYTILEWSDFMNDTMNEKKRNGRIDRIFDIIGVKPNEYFRMINVEFNVESNGLYRIDDDLKLHLSTLPDEYVERDSSNALIIDILRGKEKIIPAPTKEEQIAIDYARTLGCEWIAKDREGLVYAFTKKPQKLTTVWNVKNGEHYVINVPISFIHWEDDEPYYIGD